MYGPDLSQVNCHKNEGFGNFLEGWVYKIFCLMFKQKAEWLVRICIDHRYASFHYIKIR